MTKHVLITGGTGMIGGALTDKFQDAGFEVAYLSRSSGLHEGVRKYKWNISDNFIDPEAFHWADYIIHLAGAGIADKRWSADRKKTILESRTKSSKLLYKELSKRNYNIKHIISSSAIGYYGYGDENTIFRENAKPAENYLADVTRQWEEETMQFSKLGIKNSIVRAGVVLSTKGGAFKKIRQPIKYGLGAPLGTGKQLVSWIHIDDLVGIFEYIIDSEIDGTYNAVAPEPVSNEKLTKETAHMMRMPLFLPNVPEIALKMVFGEMSEIILKGSFVASDKIRNSGYKFHFENISEAVYDLVLRKV